ncbi:MAG TPA: VOC family protein [Thermoanaerobaculia bacterium]|jgi:catechol 2,3-dioxygenase-like lactoylglutathione lyase family enzyme
MLDTLKMVVFVPTTDYERARPFYEEVLGLRFITSDGFALIFEANGVTVRVVKAPEFQPARYTIVGWEVPDIHDAVRTLEGRGVAFERYGFFEQDELGVWTAPSGDKVAWFKDPDGNTLSVSQHVRE